MSSAAVEGLFAAIERDLLHELRRKPPLLEAMYEQAIGENPLASDSLVELKHWLQLVRSFHPDRSERVGAPLVGWLKRRHEEGIVTRKDLVGRLLDLAESSPEREQIRERVTTFLPAGLQLMLLAYHPGPRMFRGIEGWSNILPGVEQTRVIRTIRVPYGHGTVSRMLDELTPQNSVAPLFGVRVAYCQDAALDPVGRVASQDYVCGNRCVIGFPLFATLGSWSGPESLAGFCFLTHPLPGALRPLTRLASRLQRKYSPHLANLCRDRVLSDFSADLHAYGATDRGHWIHLQLPETDPAGFQAIRGSASQNKPLFGLSESALAQALTTRLAQITFVKTWAPPWPKGADGIQDRAAASNGAPVPMTLESWTQRAVSPPQSLIDDLENILTLLGSRDEDPAGSTEFVLPILRNGRAEALLCFNLDRRRSDGTNLPLCEDGEFARCWSQSAGILARVRSLLEDILAAENRQTGDRFASTIKRVADVWYMLATWLLERSSSALSGQAPEPRTPTHSGVDAELDTAGHVLSGLATEANLSLSAQNLSAELAQLQTTVGVCSSVLAEKLTDCSLVTFWSVSWLPRIEHIDGDLKTLAQQLGAHPAYLRRLAYEKVAGTGGTVAAGPSVLWSQVPAPKKDMQLLAAAAVPGKLTGRVFTSANSLPPAQADVRLLRALSIVRPVETTETALAWSNAPEVDDGAPIRYLCWQGTRETPFASLALAQLRTRLRERREVALQAEVDSVRQAIVMLSHEFSQVSGYLDRETAVSQPEIFDAARSYFDIWAIPKRRPVPLYCIKASDYASAGGAHRYLERVFGSTASAASVIRRRKDLRYPDNARNRSNYAAELARMMLVVASSGLSLGLSRQLDDPDPIDPDRSALFSLTQAMAAAFLNALLHIPTLITFKGRDVWPIVVELSESSVSILNPCIGALRASSTTKPVGTLVVLKHCCYNLSAAGFESSVDDFVQANSQEAQRASAALELTESACWYRTRLQFAGSGSIPFVQEGPW